MNGASSLERYQGFDGGDFVIWVAQAKMIGQLIKEWKINPVPREHLPYHRYTMMSQPVTKHEAEAEERLTPIIPRPFPGGLKIAHFHYKGEIYLLNKEQWQEFTSLAIGMVKDKIQNAKTVNYKPLMELTETALAM